MTNFDFLKSDPGFSTFADAAISCGIIALILIYSKYLNSIMEGHSKEETKK